MFAPDDDRASSDQPATGAPVPPPDRPASDLPSGDPLELTPAQQRFVFALLGKVARWVVGALRHPSTLVGLVTSLSALVGVRSCAGPTAQTTALTAAIAQLAAHDSVQDRDRADLRVATERVEHKIDGLTVVVRDGVRLACRHLEEPDQAFGGLPCDQVKGSGELPLPARAVARDGTMAPRFVVRTGEVAP